MSQCSKTLLYLSQNIKERIKENWCI